MISNFYSKVTTVSSRFGLDKLVFASDWLVKSHADLSNLLSSRSRNFASMPSPKVRELLELARAQGMKPKDFELACARLEPNTATRSGTGFNGNLWRHYMQTDAAMSCIFFANYTQEFNKRGWLTLEQGAQFTREAMAVQVFAKLGRPASSEDLEVKISLAWLVSIIKRISPEISNRTLGAALRNISCLPLHEQAAAARETGQQLLMIESHSKKIEQKQRNARIKCIKFGTNLSH